MYLDAAGESSTKWDGLDKYLYFNIYIFFPFFFFFVYIYIYLLFFLFLNSYYLFVMQLRWRSTGVAKVEAWE